MEYESVSPFSPIKSPNFVSNEEQGKRLKEINDFLWDSWRDKTLINDRQLKAIELYLKLHGNIL